MFYSLELDWFLNSMVHDKPVVLRKGSDVMLWRNAGAKSIKESCGRVTYMIIPLNVLDFYKYRTGAIAFEVDSHFIFRKPRAYTKERAAVTKERLR